MDKSQEELRALHFPEVLHEHLRAIWEALDTPVLQIWSRNNNGDFWWDNGSTCRKVEYNENIWLTKSWNGYHLVENAVIMAFWEAGLLVWPGSQVRREGNQITIT